MYVDTINKKDLIKFCGKQTKDVSIFITSPLVFITLFVARGLTGLNKVDIFKTLVTKDTYLCD